MFGWDYYTDAQCEAMVMCDGDAIMFVGTYYYRYILVSNFWNDLSIYISFVSVPACSRVCQNEGTLDTGTCMCDCAGGFSGDNCDSECSSEWSLKQIHTMHV